MSTVLWTCDGCGVSVTTEEGPLEQLARNGGPRDYNDLQWREGRRSERLVAWGGLLDLPWEEPPFNIDEKPYCPGCAQSCAGCGIDIFSHSELESGDTYGAGSAFLPEGKYRKDEALCVDCFSECCDKCGASPTEECLCDHDRQE